MVNEINIIVSQANPNPYHNPSHIPIIATLLTQNKSNSKLQANFTDFEKVKVAFQLKFRKHTISLYRYLIRSSNSSAIDLLPILEPRQANLCLRAFRHDKF